MYRPESLVWLEGYQALLRWRRENGITDLAPSPTTPRPRSASPRASPLGRWVHRQRKAPRTGELEERRKKLLDAPEAATVWEPGEAAWERKLAMFRA
ncbi:helicase associated domain-containing protein [Streptomyces sp. NWU49]|uniref:helicase associated domain-containing protein n=1 Tax=Streptomyces sp. NWU49 TaxID=2201153 RepID=UPI0015E8096D|nr:helicase associated domain-containing protein [Streptomyces sp. NWU49]